MHLRKLGHKVDQDFVFNQSGLDPALGRGCWTKELAAALRENVENVGGGVVSKGGEQVTVRTLGRVEKPADFGRIVKMLKDSKLKVQSAINGDLIRISGKDRDTLQQAIALLRKGDFGLELQFINFRTN